MGAAIPGAGMTGSAEIGFMFCSRLDGSEDGLGEALTLETTAGELGIGHLGQLFEARGGLMRLLDERKQAGEVGSKGLKGIAETAERAGNQ
jgi:hypothetical protein